jgi:hypothetical protein
MPELLQHIVVTIVALGAVVVVCRRVFSVVQPLGSNPKCASCPSAQQPAPAVPAEAKPLPLFTSTPSR